MVLYRSAVLSPTGERKEDRGRLINTQGKLVGVFSAKINPMNAVIINAIRSVQ
jgi:hypothetical protein